MKILIHTILLCLLFSLGNAQVYFNNRYDLHTRADVAGSVFLHQGEYFVPCGGLDITQSNLSLSVMQVDLNGVVTNSSHYFKQNNWFYSAQIGKMNPFNDSVLMYIGTRIGPGVSMTYTYWFKNNLDSVRYKEYGFPTKENYINRFVSDGGSNIYQVGYVDSSYTNTDILLIKIDTSGNEIWKKKIGLPNCDEIGWSIKMSNDNKLLISGNKRIHNNQSTNGAYILKADTNGVIIWDKYFPSNYGLAATRLVEKTNGDIIAIAGRGYGSSISRYELIKLDVMGNTIFDKVYGPMMHRAEAYSLIENNEGNLVAAGQLYYQQFNIVSALLYVFNQNGDSLFSREYLVGGGQNYFRDVIQAPDKGYVFAGFFAPNPAVGGTGTEDIWLVKTDSTFCEGFFNCGYPSGIESSSQVESLINVYPNPAKDILYIEFTNSIEKSRIEIYDAFGKLVLNEDISTQNPSLNIQQLSSGIYFYKVIFGNKVLQNKLVIIK